MLATVIDLLEELLEKIILFLNSVSAINLSLLATKLHGLLSNRVAFLRILDKLQFKVADTKFDEEAKAQRNKAN